MAIKNPRMHTGYVGQQLKKLTTDSDIDVNLRNCEADLLAPRMKTSNGQKAISFRAAKVWNGLKHEVKLAPSLSTFKCRLKCI